MKAKIWPELLICMLLAACAQPDYVPKPHAYPRIDFPAKNYRLFDSAGSAYTFEMPLYAAMQKDTSGVYTAKPGWFNMRFIPFDATLHITYHKFSNWAQYDSLINDTRKLVNKHIQRAEDITENPVYNPDRKLYGMIFDIQGNTATNFNFYLTDSNRHFFRGALYFNKQTNPDSIAPVYDFMRKDLAHLIETFAWK